MVWAGQDVLRVSQVVAGGAEERDTNTRCPGLNEYEHQRRHSQRRRGSGATGREGGILATFLRTLCFPINYIEKVAAFTQKSPPLNAFVTQQQKSSGITDVLSMFVTPGDLL